MSPAKCPEQEARADDMTYSESDFGENKSLARPLAAISGGGAARFGESGAEIDVSGLERGNRGRTEDR